MRPQAILLGTLLVFPVVASAQTAARPQAPAPSATAPPRDNQQQEKTGTARLSGRVTAGDTGKPLRRALVQATSPDNPQGRSISTDADGRWELKALPAASYRIRVQKGGYVAIFYGQMRPFAQGKVVDVSEGQVVEKLDVSLPRAGVITGAVMDEFGEPVTGARVTAMRYGYMNGQRRLVNSGGVAGLTDDIGQYRLHGLTPGEYVISAAMSFGLLFNSSDDRIGYGTTYYPSTLVSTEAQRVRVAEGQEIPQVTITLSPTRIATISGTAVNSSSRPITRGFITLATEATQTMVGTSLKPDGSFSFANLAPGEYRVSVQYSASADDSGPFLSPGGPSGTEYASAAVTINGRDVTGLALVTSIGGIAKGRVVFDGGTPPRSVSPASLSLSAAPMSAVPNSMGIGGGSARIRDDWTFEISGLFDRRRFRVNNVPTGWYLKSVTQDGSDVTDSGLDFSQAQKIANVDVVLSSAVTTLSGTVQDSRAKPVTDYVVVAFSQDSSKWGYLTRFIRTARPNQEGRFSLTGLPPDDYYVIALDYVEMGEESDPEQLEKWKSLATRVTLADAESKPLTLKLASQVP
jgi:protocatechuate 3,4-dioxygenase beta subunit